MEEGKEDSKGWGRDRGRERENIVPGQHIVDNHSDIKKSKIYSVFH